MNRFNVWTIFTTALGLLATAGVAGAEEEKIAVKQLPKAVLKAVKAKFPKAEIKAAAEEEEDGKTTYEVSLEFKGHSFDVALKPDGTILEIEKEVSVDELPKAVQKALAVLYPKAKIEKAEEISSGHGGPVRYEVSVATEVVLTAKGKLVEADEEDDDDEKAPAKAKKAKKSHKDEDEMDDDDDDEKPSAKAKKAKKSHKDEDEMDDDDDDEKPSAKAKKAKKAKKSHKDDDDDDDDDKS